MTLSAPHERAGPAQRGPGGRRRQPRNMPSSDQIFHMRATADTRKHTKYKQHEPRQHAKSIMGAWEPREQFEVPPARAFFGRAPGKIHENQESHN